MSHTPGPWRVGEGSHERGRIVDQNGLWIASTWDGCIDNTQLIAAAPDLLAALKSLLAVVQAVYCAAPNDGPEHDDLMRTYIEPARAAIAKANGEYNA